LAVGPAGPVPGFEIIGELGRGGMGVVYKARQVGLNRLVALKRVLGGAGRAEVARFLGEAEAVATVRHPHVVQVYEFGGSDECPYLVMEYLGGGSLSGAIREAGRLTPEAAAILVEKVARGIQAAHDHGIVHRDVKPANVLFDETGEPKVTDFGLAKRDTQGDLTATNAVMGTPAYMAPEQAAGRTKFVGPAADIYALGVVLYECLTGSVPFAADDTWSVVRLVIEEPPEPIRKRVPDVPRDLELICLKCLEKDPRARYPTAAALADDLRRFRTGEPVSVRPPSLGAMVRFWARQHFGSAGWTLAGGVACGAVAGANVLIDMFGRKVPEARAKFAQLIHGGPAPGSARVPDLLLAVVEGVMFLLVPAILFATAVLVRPRSRSADLAAGLLTGVIAAVSFFTISYAWWAAYSVAVRPAVDDLALLAEPGQEALAGHPAVGHLPPGERRPALAAKIHNDLLLRLPWAVISGMILAVTLTVPIGVVLVGTAGGLIRMRGLRPVIFPLYLEIGVPTLVFAVHVFFLLNRALWYGMWPQYPAAYAGLLGLCALAVWLAARGGPKWARVAAQLIWIGFCVVTKYYVLYEYE
jgi:tRNA A-37 threonylcarbamoyl transferase component Bud32